MDSLRFWQSLDELSDSPEFLERLKQEFPEGAAFWNENVERRSFLKIMAASLALAGFGACVRRPKEWTVPYVMPAEYAVPGKPAYYATAMTHGGFAIGLLGESHLGRPIKVEGNREHPASLGATDIFSQASVLTLYDPERSKAVLHEGLPSNWDAFTLALASRMSRLSKNKGRGLRILTETVTSPTLSAQLRQLLVGMPQARWYQYEPFGRDAETVATRTLFGEELAARFDFSKADVVFSLDSDFFSVPPGRVRYAREFMKKRQVFEQARMSRIYCVESTPGLVGAIADHRLALRASEVEELARAVARALGVAEGRIGEPTECERVLEKVNRAWIKAVVEDLKSKGPHALVVPGEFQSPAVHMLAYLMNQHLGSVGHTIVFIKPVVAKPADFFAEISELTADMRSGRVDTLIILGANPVYTAPADVDFARALEKVEFSARLGLYLDETSPFCKWHVPAAHYLESWSDARAFDGTATIIQPLIEPLYNGKTAHELIGALADKVRRSSHEIVKSNWREWFNRKRSRGTFDAFWRKSLHDGVVVGSAYPVRTVTLKKEVSVPPRTANPKRLGLEVIFRPDPTIWDGTYANNAWLQALPKPLTKLVWDNAALVSPRTAKRLGLEYEKVVELHFADRKVRAPLWIMPGHADESVTLYTGYGRRGVGTVGDGYGFDAFSIRPSWAPHVGLGLEIRKTGEAYELATTQHHYTMAGRNMVRMGTLEEYRTSPSKIVPAENSTVSLYPDFAYTQNAWGMAINLNACIGCASCVVACQSENNIPSVGKQQVLMGRAMHWLRIDRYYEGVPQDPKTYFQPVPCMHCEKAPCEPVCPVAATTHSDEGLNEMTYQRCIGTRYCSNNCPYKVRRFNFLNYTDVSAEVEKFRRNPDVTVRSRGVMEKCTYCVQRISAARIEAKKEDRKILDGEVKTACQEACPTEAIIFGDINDRTSKVYQLKQSKLNYALLGELGTRPRTTYLAVLRNPNMKFKKKLEEKHEPSG